jgi:hypothetical protein
MDRVLSRQQGYISKWRFKESDKPTRETQVGRRFCMVLRLALLRFADSTNDNFVEAMRA